VLCPTKTIPTASLRTFKPHRLSSVFPPSTPTSLAQRRSRIPLQTPSAAATMIIFKDILTGDEVISDSYDLKTIDDTVYEVDGKKITKGAENIDIGANPSAEEQEEALDETSVQVIDIVDAFRFQKIDFDKKSYLSQLKAYMRKVKAALKEKGASEEAIKKFETSASAYAKKIIANFGDYEFYVGESMDPDGMVVLLNYREDGFTPYFTIWKDGLTEMKV